MNTQSFSTNSPHTERLPRILVVDDEPSFTRLLKINLEGSGNYRVREVNDAQLALPEALEFRPDLVLLDVMMPGLDGGDVCKLFADQPRLKNTSIIFLTATVLRAEVEANHGRFGGQRFLSKPIDLPNLMRELEEHFAAL